MIPAFRGTGPQATRPRRHPPASRRQRRRLGPLAIHGRPLTAFSLLVVGALVVLAALPFWLAPDDPIKIDLIHRLQSPSWRHIFGTDEFGRDMLSRIIYGTRISLATGLLVVGVATAVGCSLGAAAAYAGSWVDEVIMRITDVFFAFPPILLPMIVVVVLSPGLVNTVIALAVVWWPAYARLMRAQVLAIKQLEYVEAARMVGGGPLHIVYRHIIPNAFAPIAVMATMDLGFVILSAAGLGFLGLGAQAPTPEWGAMTSAGLPFLLTSWWYAIFPGIAIAVTVLGFNLLGDELQTQLDPHAR